MITGNTDDHTWSATLDSTKLQVRGISKTATNHFNNNVVQAEHYSCNVSHIDCSSQSAEATNTCSSSFLLHVETTLLH